MATEEKKQTDMKDKSMDDRNSSIDNIVQLLLTKDKN